MTLILFLLILGLIVFIHEFGHFIMAKLFKVYIYEFSIGMGPVIHQHKGKDNVMYSIRALPIGGYVSMAGEVAEDDDKVKKSDFLCNKPWWQRIIIFCAGVFNNFLLALVLFFIIAMAWGARVTEPVFSEITPNSAMDIAGAEVGDRIISINNKKVTTWDRAQILLIEKSKDNNYQIVVERNGQQKTLNVTPEIVKDEKGKESKVYGMTVSSRVEHGFVAAIKYAFHKFVSIFDTMILTIGGLFTGKISITALSGPVGIYTIVGEARTAGLFSLLYLVAYLSLNLGFINILPFPAFDGGHVLFTLIEVIIRRPVNKKVEAVLHFIGFILIFALMIAITIHDVWRLV